MELTIPMALVDFVPVALFLVSAVLLQRGLYGRMSKGAFALFSAGTVMIFCAGFCKALWKLLYAAGICDFDKLNQMFFPLQSLGFLLAGLAVVAMLTVPQQERSSRTAAAAAPAVFSGTMVFVAMMLLGAVGLCVGLAVVALRMKKRGTAVLYILALAGMLGMGYLSSRSFEQAFMNWVAEGVNIFGQACLLAATVKLTRAGLADAGRA